MLWNEVDKNSLAEISANDSKVWPFCESNLITYISLFLNIFLLSALSRSDAFRGKNGQNNTASIKSTLKCWRKFCLTILNMISKHVSIWPSPTLPNCPVFFTPPRLCKHPALNRRGRLTEELIMTYNFFTWGPTEKFYSSN